jgi:3-deoxy-manno-octulosonate cytidylyltransferase (CMP-KDO synthetase)
MIEHVWYRASGSRCLTEVVVATCDAAIRDAVEAFGGLAVMTSRAHERGTDRIAEAAATLSLGDMDIAVNVQGDEPMLLPHMVDDAVRPLIDDSHLTVTNLCAPIDSEEEYADPNEIKIVTDLAGDALFMSRAPVPSNTRHTPGVARMKQVCVIAFRAPILAQFARLPQTPLEKAESIDMLRLIENGVRIRMVPSNAQTYAVDTVAGLQRVERAIQQDPLQNRFLTAFLNGVNPRTVSDSV